MSNNEENDNKSNTSNILCDTPSCGKPSKLRCPTCIKLNIKDGSNFCSQVFYLSYNNTVTLKISNFFLFN